MQGVDPLQLATWSVEKAIEAGAQGGDDVTASAKIILAYVLKEGKQSTLKLATAN